MKFDTKSNTLKKLQGGLKYGKILPQVSFNVAEYKNSNYKKIISSVNWINSKDPLIVRSSSMSEDSLHESLAGHFESVLDVTGDEELDKAIEKVVKSFKDHNENDQIFIQPMLTSFDISGVAFTRDPSNAGHYYVVNYDNSRTATTSSVTDGSSNLNSYYHFKSIKKSDIHWVNNLLKLLRELEGIFLTDALDVEFAIQDDVVFLFQVRPLILEGSDNVGLPEQEKCLNDIDRFINSKSKTHPYLLGDSPVYGVMPDWNPAEIIGIRPKPLSLSLYKDLVTDGVWAYQRDNYGYRNLRGFPLLYNLAGFPYIDVRISFTSFIPKDLNIKTANKLVNYYLNYLRANPKHHDRVEFDIVFSCYTFNTKERLLDLKNHDFTDNECSEIENSLKQLTNSIINDRTGLWRKDVAKIDELKIRQKTIVNGELEKIEKIYWLMEDCKRYGTLPFAGLARAGFIAVEILRSLVTNNVFSEHEYEDFMGSVNTISSDIFSDFNSLSKVDFIDKYGHLRPGTYDIESCRYDENFNTFFGDGVVSEQDHNHFSLSLDSMNDLNNLLEIHGIEHGALSLLNFIKSAIEAREYAKFIFTKSLSDAMLLISELGSDFGLSNEDLSYLDVRDITNLYSSSSNIEESIRQSIKKGKESYRVARGLSFPPIITSCNNVWCYEQTEGDPNFITLLSAEGHVVNISNSPKNLKNCILMIPSADPGYDCLGY